MSASEEPKKVTVTLMSSDNEMFDVDEAVAREFQIVAHMMEDGCADKPIPLENVTGNILAQVIEYCTRHVEAGSAEGNEEAQTKLQEKLKEQDAEFVKQEPAELFKLVLAANYLNVKGLLDLTCQTIADHIKDKSPEEIREIFHIENDFTPEEEAQVRKENQWAFE
ncbi:unnamed protein product [Microthlaspi erraticum]|uniref:SKP1-like protein n=1 Tax=Microthlaspi erraticum TaxID=1685480 RepID=A0A6D2JNE2_9BRAS|nr:unnamed protein product [Microthlaspi erraticum]